MIQMYSVSSQANSFFKPAYFKIPDAAPSKAPEQVSEMFGSVGTLSFTWTVGDWHFLVLVCNVCY